MPNTLPNTAASCCCCHNMPWHAMQVWPKAVDCERFHPQRASPNMRARLAGGGNNVEQPLLLYVGRVSPEKNVPLLLSVLEKVPGARLAIVGDGPALEVSLLLVAANIQVTFDSVYGSFSLVIGHLPTSCLGQDTV